MSISIIESLLISAFCMAVVFLVLSTLYFAVLALSKVLSRVGMTNTSNTAGNAEMAAPAAADVTDSNAARISAGELKLINVDEKTAAMIMAIVSHESQIPLSELCFKSIKALEE